MGVCRHLKVRCEQVLAAEHRGATVLAASRTRETHTDVLLMLRALVYAALKTAGLRIKIFYQNETLQKKTWSAGECVSFILTDGVR